MIETKFGYSLVDQLLTETDLPSGGKYTAIGTYNHGEMVTLVTKLSQHTNIPVPDLLRVYGQYMFVTFTKKYRSLIDRSDSAFSLLHSIDHHIHVEVRKLYPDAELPHFTVEQVSDRQIYMYYTSERKLSDFALGLMDGCFAHFGEKATIRKTNLVDDGSKVLFDIVKE